MAIMPILWRSTTLVAMAALAYVLLPVSGLLAFVLGKTPRLRWHGLQAVAFGTLWPIALYAASAVTPLLTQVVFVAGTLSWLGLIVGSGRGRDPRLPVIGRRLKRIADADPQPRGAD